VLLLKIIDKLMQYMAAAFSAPNGFRQPLNALQLPLNPQAIVLVADSMSTASFGYVIVLLNSPVQNRIRAYSCPSKEENRAG